MKQSWYNSILHLQAIHLEMTDHSRTNVNSVLTKSQDILELNEDLIAAIVENMQIGNLENCMKLYLNLQMNLISLGTNCSEFSNIPMLNILWNFQA
jgi:hypothetical protein